MMMWWVAGSSWRRPDEHSEVVRLSVYIRFLTISNILKIDIKLYKYRNLVRASTGVPYTAYRAVRNWVRWTEIGCTPPHCTHSQFHTSRACGLCGPVAIQTERK